MKNIFESTAKRFETVRTAHLTETTEDYVEMIADLIAQNGTARMVDLSRCMGVSQPTATKIISRLVKEELVTSKPYKDITLTASGNELASYCKLRHKIVKDFLIALGISEQTAELDAEGLEHHASIETLNTFKLYTEKNNV